MAGSFRQETSDPALFRRLEFRGTDMDLVFVRRTGQRQGRQPATGAEVVADLSEEGFDAGVHQDR